MSVYRTFCLKHSLVAFRFQDKFQNATNLKRMENAIKKTQGKQGFSFFY